MAGYMIDLKEPTMMQLIKNIHSRQQTILGQVKKTAVTQCTVTCWQALFQLKHSQCLQEAQNQFTDSLFGKKNTSFAKDT